MKPIQPLGPSAAFNPNHLDRSRVLTDLIMVEDHVAQGVGHIDKQRVLILRLERAGLNVADAELLLKLFLEMQELHVAHRDRLRTEFNASWTVNEWRA